MLFMQFNESTWVYNGSKAKPHANTKTVAAKPQVEPRHLHPPLELEINGHIQLKTDISDLQSYFTQTPPLLTSLWVPTQNLHILFNHMLSGIIMMIKKTKKQM